MDELAHWFGAAAGRDRGFYADWTAFKAERVRFHQTIIDWATIAPSWLAAGERPADTDLPFMPE
jgi:hypothetical protein